MHGMVLIPYLTHLLQRIMGCINSMSNCSALFIGGQPTVARIMIIILQTDVNVTLLLTCFPTRCPKNTYIAFLSSHGAAFNILKMSLYMAIFPATQLSLPIKYVYVCLVLKLTFHFFSKYNFFMRALITNFETKQLNNLVIPIIHSSNGSSQHAE